MSYQNPNPLVIKEQNAVSPDFLKKRKEMENSASRDEIDSFEIFELLKDIQDPEYSLSLESLQVIRLENIDVSDQENMCEVYFKPTIP